MLKSSLKPFNLKTQLYRYRHGKPESAQLLFSQHHNSTRDFLCLLESILHIHHEWWLIPEEVNLLGSPFCALWTKCKIEVVQQFANNEADLAVCQAIVEMVLVCEPEWLQCAYFFPRQFRGPRLKGWRTSFLSWSKRESWPSQRSGRKACGKVKFDEEWYDA